MATPYGLAGAEQALLAGAGYGLDHIASTQGQVSQLYGGAQQHLAGAQTSLADQLTAARSQLTGAGAQVGNLFNQGIGQLTPYQQAGQGASGVQAALSGAMGPQAQAQAMQQFQQSPYVDQTRENAERAILRNAAATGNLGSGNTMDQLYQNAAGMFMQDFGNQFNRLGSLSDRGFGAASTEAGLRGQQAGIGANLGLSGADLEMQGAGMQSGLAGARAGLDAQQAGLQGQLGQMGAQIPFQTGQIAAGMRQQAGRDIAGQAAQTTSSLANLINQQGAGMADISGQYANNINALYQQAGQGDAQAQEQLATLLANLATQSGSPYSSMPIVQGQAPSMLGQMGQVASGIGGLMQYLPGRPASGI
jgi:hypothetical protein